MKRFAAITIIAALVLTMSVGTAYAGVCIGMSCSQTVLKCADPVPTACASEMPAPASLHAACQHAVQRDVKDAVGAQPSADAAVVADTVRVPATLLADGRTHASSAPDARGAPHLTSVIRI